MFTLRKLAKAFGKENDIPALLPPKDGDIFSEPHRIRPLPIPVDVKVPLAQADTFVLNLKVARPREELEGSDELQTFLAGLRNLIRTSASVSLRDIQDGSTMLVVEMLNSDILRLLAAMMDKNLAVLRITHISIPNHKRFQLWLNRMVLSLRSCKPLLFLTTKPGTTCSTKACSTNSNKKTRASPATTTSWMLNKSSASIHLFPNHPLDIMFSS